MNLNLNLNGGSSGTVREIDGLNEKRFEPCFPRSERDTTGRNIDTVFMVAAWRKR